jgi:hypothetical protein
VRPAGIANLLLLSCTTVFMHILPAQAHLLLVLSAAGHGITVTPSARDSSGQVVEGAPFHHYAVLGGVHADSPARSKLMYTIASFTAFLACAFCKLMGTKVCGVVRYLGYAEPVLTTVGVGVGKLFHMGPTGASDRLMSDAEMKAQAAAAEYYKARKLEPPPGNRYKGFSPLVRDLYWVDPRRLFIVPFCHAFYLGMFKDLMKMMFAKKQRAEVRPACADQQV